ncbi:MAG: peptidylprolyl isomerase [bacterium]
MVFVNTRRLNRSPITAARTAVRGLVLVLVLVPGLSLTGCGPDSAARNRALEAVARWEDRRIAPEDSLLATIAHDDAHIRLAAVRAAGLIGRDFAVDALVRTLEDPSLTVRREACFALGLLGTPAAAAALGEAAADPRGSVRLAALRGLAHCPQDGRALLTAARGESESAAAAWDALRNHAARVDRTALLEALAAGLLRPEADVRWRVLRCAELVPDSTLAPLLIPFAQSDVPQVRVHAYRALARQNTAQALDAVLEAAADHADIEGRNRHRMDVALARALGALGSLAFSGPDRADAAEPASVRVANLLIRLAESEDPFVAASGLDAMAAAVAGLTLPPEAAAQESLLPVWRIRMARTARSGLDDERPGVRAAAAGAWPALRGEGSLAEMASWLRRTADPAVRAAALTALGRIHPDPLVFLAGWCDASQPAAWVQDGRAAPHPPQVRAAALEALADAVRDRPQAAPPGLPADRYRERVRDILIEASASADFVVASTAAARLGGFPSPAAAAALVALWDRAEGPNAPDLMRAVIAGLGGILEAAAPADDAAADSAAGSLPDSLRTAATNVLRRAFDVPDVRIRLDARRVALDTRALPDHLIPSEASLRATLPPVARSPLQPPVTLPFAAPRVLCVTDKGTFTITLFGDLAPNTCAVFLDLIGRGFYDGLTFHRVVPDFVVQGGCPRGDGWGGPGYNIRSEWSPTPFRRGIVGIAHDGKDTGGSQFFVTLSEQPHLNGRYTVFGEVTEGMEVVDRMEIGDRFTLETVP